MIIFQGRRALLRFALAPGFYIPRLWRCSSSLMQYHDFDLWIDAKPSEAKAYPARAASNMGQVTDGSAIIDPFAETLTVQLQRLATGTANPDICKSIGEMLFNGVFQDGIGRLYQRSLGSARSGDKEGLRIRLRIEPPELAALPWELLYDKEEDFFLATSAETPLLRYLEMPMAIKDLETPLPLNVLLIIPHNPDLDTAREEKLIVEAFGGLNEKATKEVGTPAVNYDTLNGEVTAERINDELSRSDYHIIHFIGHGTFKAGQGYLQLTPEKDADGLITAENFGYFFLGNSSVKLVVLNACKSAASSTMKLVTGVGQQLVKRSVPAVVAMQFSISDKAAQLFADCFYQNLCIGKEPGRVDTAVSHARRWVMQNVGQSSDFVAPVLLMRSINGMVFDTQEQTTIIDELHRVKTVDDALVLMRSIKGMILDPKAQTPNSSFIDEIHRVKTVAETRLSNVDVLKAETSEATKPEAKQQLKTETDALKSARKKLIEIYAKVLAAALPQLALVVIAVGVLGFLAYYTKFFNIWHLDDAWQRGFLSHLTGYVKNPINDNVRVILIDEGNNRGFGVYATDLQDENKAAEWRRRHATLIEGLKNAGAKVIAFDLVFSKPTTEDANQAMCQAIGEARATGRTEVIAAKQWDNGNIPFGGDITSTLQPCLNDNWANTHVGIERWDLVSEYELAHKTTSGTNNAGSLIPSFALRAVTEFDQRGATPQYNETSEQIQIASASGTRKIPVQPAGEGLNMMIGYADEQDLDAITRDYSTTYEGLQRSDAAMFSDLGGRIVIVGAGGKDLRNVLGGSKPRYGVHIHANAISNILNGFYVYPLSNTVYILIMLAMAAIGFLIQTRFRSWLRPTIPIPLSGASVKFPVLFVLIIIAYAVFAFIVFLRTHIVFDVSYHLLAFVISFFAVDIFRRKLGLK